VPKATSVNRAFGAALRELRLKADVSQEDFANLCGVHRTYVSQLERGLKSPSLRILFAIGEALGVPPHRLVKQTEDLLR
jgi:transcriptional regulator with XRE-family HTH domain